MPNLYQNMAATTKRLMDSYGRSITLRRTTQEYDPITGGTVDSTEDLITTGIVKSYNANLIDGTRIQSGDRELVLTDEQAPQMSDSVVIDGPWSIVTIETIKPADVVIGYRLQVRS